MNRRFGGTYQLYLQGRKSTSKAYEPSQVLALWFLAWHIFDPEHGGDTFLRNVTSYTDYRALYLRKLQIS
jgi:hypothetical protein